MVSAVIFDMDGLMFDTERLGIEAWKYAGACMGYEVPDWLPIAAIGRSKADCEDLIVDTLSSTEEAGTAFDYERGCELFAKYIFEVVNAEGMPIKPGLVELLDYLDERSMPYTLATSSAPGTVGFYLTSAGMAERFPRIVTADMVKRGKPAPDVFLEAARLIGQLPKDCLVLEDSEAGILAAHDAGCHVILIPDIMDVCHEVRALADEELTNLAQVIEWLRANSD